MPYEIVTGAGDYQLWLEYINRPIGHTVSTIGYVYNSITNTHAETSNVNLTGTAGPTTFATLEGIAMNLAGTPEALNPAEPYAWVSVFRAVDIATGFVLGTNTTPAITHVPYNRTTFNWLTGHVNPYFGGYGNAMDFPWQSASALFVQRAADWVAELRNGPTIANLDLALWDADNSTYTGVWDGQPVGSQGILIDFAYMKAYNNGFYGGWYNPIAFNVMENPIGSLTIDISPVWERLTAVIYPYGPPVERELGVEFPFDVAITGADTVSPGDGKYEGDPKNDDPQSTPGGKVVRRPKKDYDSNSPDTLDLENDETDTELTEPVTLNILVNDIILSGVETVTLYTEPTEEEGTATLEEVDDEWIVTFTAAEGFTGLVKFRYQVVDKDGKTARATIRVMVTSPGDPPTYWIDDTAGSLVIIKDKNRIYYLAAGQVILTYLLSPAAMSLIVASGFYLRYASDPPEATIPTGWTFTPPILGGAQYVLHAFEETSPLYLTTGLRRHSINRSGVAVLIKDGVVSFDSMPSESQIREADYYFPGGRDVVIPRAIAQLIINSGKPLEWVTLYV